MSVINNNAYKFYNQLIESFSAENVQKGMDDASNNLFVHAAINLAAADAENPFDVDTEAYQRYFAMMRHHGLWRLGGPDRKVSRRRFLAEAVQQASLGMENPFEFELEPVIEIEDDHISLEALAEKEYEIEDAAAVASGTYIPVEIPITIMGVIPEDEDEVDEVEVQHEAVEDDSTQEEPSTKKPGILKRILNKIMKKTV